MGPPRMGARFILSRQYLLHPGYPSFKVHMAWTPLPRTAHIRIMNNSHGYCSSTYETRRFISSSKSRNAENDSQESLPLKGITVVSLEQAIAAPFCTRQLADLGARVIKVERPVVGDFARSYDTRVAGLSSHFVWTNRSKESLTLDLKQDKDLRVLKKLLAKADVLVQNLAPGATDRLGVSYQKLHRDFPSLIVCDISGYGDSGPYRNKKAYDLLVQSEAGLLSITGSEGRPAKVGISIADISAGMYALTNILGALMKRSMTGKGSRIDVSMLESMAEWMSFPLYYSYQNQPPPKLVGLAHATVFPYGPFATGGGGTVLLGVQNEREWVRLCSDVLGDASLATDPRFLTNSRRNENRQELTRIMVDKFSSLSAEDVIARLDEAGIANANVNDMQGLWNHPQLQARGRWTEIATPAGRVPALIPPGIPSVSQVRMDEVPAVGQHTKAILKELGLEDPESES